LNIKDDNQILEYYNAGNGWIRGSHFINIEQIDGVYKIISMGTSP